MSTDEEGASRDPRELFQDRDSRLEIRLFGAYAGCYSHALEYIRDMLIENDYENTEICSCIGFPPEPPDDVKRPVYNWRVSLECMNEADCAAFIFFEPDEYLVRERQDLIGLNTSVTAEFVYWLRILRMMTHKPSVAVFESEKTYEKIGSLIVGIAEEAGIETYKSEKDDWLDIAEYISSRAVSWAEDMDYKYPES